MTLPFQVNTHDDDTPTSSPVASRTTNEVPHSPPPSFHSRASSLAQRDPRRPVDPTLEDAFDGDDSDDDSDEPDDRQRLVRSNTDSQSRGQEVTSRFVPPSAPVAAPSSGARATPGRVYGGGIQSDGVFSNLTAKPERASAEKDEQPPVCCMSWLRLL